MQNIQIHTCLFSIGFTFNLVYVKIPHIFLADELLVNVVYVFRCNDLMGKSLKRTSRQSAAVCHAGLRTLACPQLSNLALQS